jgi:ATP-dependent Lhr-like helicase
LRVKDYTPQWLDQLCLTGRLGWGRLSRPQNSNARAPIPLPSTPVAIFDRANLSHWRELAGPPSPADFAPDTALVFEALARSGAMFFGELVRAVQRLPSRVAEALGELTARGCATADSFEGLRALLTRSDKRFPFADTGRKRHHKSVTSVEFAGRWTLLKNPDPAAPPAEASPPSEAALDAFAWVLLRRYGVVFRRLLERESLRVSWYELGRVYRRLEARGEIRGGHFINGVSGEQFALPEAIGLLRSLRKAPSPGELVTISAADPLNLTGILTAEARIPAIAANRLLMRDGLPIAALVGGEIKSLHKTGHPSNPAIQQALIIGQMSPTLRLYYS